MESIYLYNANTILEQMDINNFSLPLHMKEEALEDTHDLIKTDKEITLWKYQPHHDEATKFILKNFLSKSDFVETEYINKFIPLVFNTFNKYIEKYWNKFIEDKTRYYNNIKYNDVICFYLKGGNAIKVLINKLKAALYNFKIVDNISNFFQLINENKLAERSDFDFSIIIDVELFSKKNQLDHYNKIYGDMKILSFYCLEIIRDTIFNDKQYFYINFMKYEDKLKEFSQFTKNINNSKKFSVYEDIRNLHCVGIRYDKFYYGKQKNDVEGNIEEFDNNNLKWKININETNNSDNIKYYEGITSNAYDVGFFSNKNVSKQYKKSKTPFVITISEGIEMKLKTNKDLDVSDENPIVYHAKFDLVRLKVNFKMCMYDITNNTLKYVDVPGELIDVAIPYINMENGIGKEANIMPDKSDYLMDYGIRINEKVNGNFINKVFKFKGVSYIYQMHDLETILFKQPPYPWSDSKYEKRMLRYFIMVIIYALIKEITNINENLQHINNIINVLKDISDVCVNYHSGKVNDAQQQLILAFKRLREIMNSNKLLEEFCRSIYRILSVDDKVINIETLNKHTFSKFCAFIEKSGDFLQHVHNILTICNDQKIDLIGPISELSNNVKFGGAKNDLYKQKYLQLKEY